MNTKYSKPTLFIGSSTKGLDVSRAVELNLYDIVEVTIWSNGVFGLNEGYLDALAKARKRFDFAILVLTPDDFEQYPRDNVLFELGLFMGHLGRDRTFALCSDSEKMKLPTDLSGVVLAKYASNRSDNNLQAATNPACTLIRNKIIDLGAVKSNNLNFHDLNPNKIQDRKNLMNLIEILGAVDWERKRKNNSDAHEALQAVKTSFCFMGFGFSKFLKANQESGTISDISQLPETILWKKIEKLTIDNPKKSIRILMMDPFAYEIEKYSKILKKKFPKEDIEEDLHFSLLCLNEMQKTFGEYINVRFYPNQKSYKPSFRLFFANEQELFVSFYQWGTKGLDLPYIHLKKKEKSFYLPFEILFEYLWENGVEADIENMPLIINIKEIFSNGSILAKKIRQHIIFQLPQNLKSIPFEELKIAVVSVAGRDSTLATLKIAQSDAYDCILPILVGTPGKFIQFSKSKKNRYNLGEFSVRCETIKSIKNVLKNKSGSHLLNLLFVETDTHSWSNVFKIFSEKWNFDTSNLNMNKALSSYCIPCHFYIYYIRAKICQLIGVKHMIGGDRKQHDNIIKMNQLEIIIDLIDQCTQKIFGVSFYTPLIDVQNNIEIQKELDKYGIGSIHDVSCIFDGKGSVNIVDYMSDDIQKLKQKINDIILHALEKTFFELHS